MASPSLARRLIGVVGAGQLGSGIAQVCAVKGQQVLLCDTSEEALENGLVGIRKRLESAVRKGRISSADANSAKDRIRSTLMIEVRPYPIKFCFWSFGRLTA